MTIKELYLQSKELSVLDKTKLAEMILQDVDKSDPKIVLAWIKESVNRKHAVLSGKEKTVSYKSVMKKYLK